MKKVSKLSLVVVLVIAVLTILGTQVSASGLIDLSNTGSDTGATTNNTATDNNSTGDTIAPINNLNTTNTANTTNTTNNSVYNNTNLPSTGAASDFTVIALVVVCAVSALYAYKKIRDYNIK